MASMIPLSDLPGRRLESWKETAAYLRRSERTVRRWEDKEGLPVHRHTHDKRGSDAVDPMFDGVRTDPRFVALMRRMGLR